MDHFCNLCFVFVMLSCLTADNLSIAKPAVQQKHPGD